MKARTPTSTLRPAFHHSGDRADDGRLLSEGFLQGGPVFRTRDLGAGELVVAVSVAALNRHQQLVARLYLLAFVLEIGQGQDAFALVADIQKDRIRGYGNDGSFELFAAIFTKARVALFILGKQLIKRFVGFGRSLRFWIVCIRHVELRSDGMTNPSRITVGGMLRRTGEEIAEK